VSNYDMQAQRYLILIEGGPPSNYSAWTPDLPGCVATGASLEEVEREMRAAIALHLQGIVEDGGRFRNPRARACTSSANRAAA
jgi:predicted RNase H-like HicB family nuclease